MNTNTPRIRIGDKIRTHSGLLIKVTIENVNRLQRMLDNRTPIAGIARKAVPMHPLLKPFYPTR